MKYTSIIIFILISMVSCKMEKSDLSKVAIIPKPVSVVSTGSYFELSDETNLYIDASLSAYPAAEETCKQLAATLRDLTGFPLTIHLTNRPPGSGHIYVTALTSEKKDASSQKPAYYELDVNKDLIQINGNRPEGIFYGAQTLLQLLPPGVQRGAEANEWKIPTGTIKDYPTYDWRGSMLDVARHFFSVDDVKRYIDLISTYKMNILHLHLSDDQGWRIEIKSWPNLTTHGGSTAVGGGKGGFYTQEQYKEIVAYAESRFVIIIPEIDLPGHINSALASYGELNGGTIVPVEGAVKVATQNDLGKKNKPTELYTGIEVGWSTLRYEKEATFRFVNDVIREISAITPGPYFHIGGDEASATRKEDYIKFINRFTEIVMANKKTMVGWEEIAQGDIDDKVITQFWKSEKYASLAVEKGSRLIMSPSKRAYIDMSYDSTSKLGLHWAAYIEVDSAYDWNPSTLIKNISSDHVLGVEAPLWTETLTTMDELEYMAFPRLPGYAEIGWSPEAGRSWKEYRLRLAAHGKRMEAMGIDFYRSPKVPWDSVNSIR